MMVIDGLGNGGAERQLCLLSRSLPPAWAACVWSLDGGRYEQELRDAGVPTRVCRRRFRTDLGPVLDLAGHVRRQKPDVIHSWSWMSAWAAEIVSRVFRVPHVAGLIRRGTLPPRRTRRAVLATKLGARVLANSQAGLEAYGVPIWRGRVLHNGFDGSRLAQCAPSPRPTGSPFTVVMAATVDWRKDFDSFLEAARLLGRESAAGSWQFVVLGDGPDLAELRRKAAAQHLSSILDMPGGVPEVISYLRRADVGVLMSTDGEGQSNSIMEYMACGLPVVCSEGGGNRELVADGRTGFVVPARDPHSLAARLRQLADDRVLAVSMGEAGRQRILTDFSADRMGQAAVAVYSELIAARRDLQSGPASMS